MVMALTFDQLVAQIAASHRTEKTAAIAISGSHVRRDATPYSDIDLLFYSTEPDEPDYRLEYQHGHLVSLSRATFAQKSAELTRPESAIWAVPGLRQLRILEDATGALAALKKSADEFEWEPLQEAANSYASTQLMGYAEEAHKILSGLYKVQESTVLYGLWGLVHGMTTVVLVQHGVLVPTENALFELAQVTAGLESAWTRYFRLAMGLTIRLARPSPTIMRGIPALYLYRETVQMMQDILKPADAAVCLEAVRHIEKSGYKLDS